MAPSQFSKGEKLHRFISSVGILYFKRIMQALIVPIVSKWTWVTLKSDNRTHVLYGNESLAFDTDRGEITEHGDITYELSAVFLISPVLSILLSPVAGAVGDRFGHDLPLIIGLIVILFMILFFVASSSFILIFVAKAAEGISQPFLTPIALARIIEAYPSDTKEGKIALGIAMTCNFFSFFGSVYSGLMVEKYGQRICFLSILPVPIALTISVISTFKLKYPISHESRNELQPSDNVKTSSEFSDTSEETQSEDTSLPDYNSETLLEERSLPEEGNCLEISSDDKSLLGDKNEDKKPSSNIRLMEIATDYQIIIAIGVMTVAWLGKASLEPVFSLWVFWTFQSGPIAVGLAWGMAGFAVLASNFISSQFAAYKSDAVWIFLSVHLALCAPPLALLPLSSSLLLVAICLFVYVYCACAARYAIISLFSKIAETKYDNSLGRVMGVANFGFNIPYIIAPIISVVLSNKIGFKYMCILIATIIALYVPLTYLLSRIEKPLYKSIYEIDVKNYQIIHKGSPKMATTPVTVNKKKSR